MTTAHKGCHSEKYATTQFHPHLVFSFGRIFEIQERTGSENICKVDKQGDYQDNLVCFLGDLFEPQ